MKKIFTFFLFLFILGIAINASAQLSGPKSIPGDYATVEAAITALNAQGVGAGGVTFNVAAGHTETFTSPLAGVITATGTDPNQIIFQKSGAGSNPLITSGLGTIASSTTITAYGDGIIIIEGGDYITFDGIDLQENPVAAGVEKMEFGYFLKKASSDDASKNVTIKNCSITLDNTTIYSWGIYVSNFVGTTSVTVTSIGGRSENIKIFNNTISNVYGGIQLRGYISTGNLDLYDHNIEIGVDGPNSITNYGGGSTTAYGTYAIYQNNLKVANNTINGSGNLTLYGIFNSTGTNSNVDIYNNTVTITGGGTTSTIYAINNSMGATGTDNTVNIYNNIVENCTYPGATSGAMYHVYNTASAFNVNMYGNIIRNNSKPGTSGSMYLLYSQSTGANGFVNIYNNTIHNNSNAAATGDLFCLYSNEVSTATKMVYNNTIYNNSGGDDVYGINSTLGVLAHIYGNNIYDITTTTALTTSPYNSGITIGSGTEVYVYNNFISDLKAPNCEAVDAVRGISMTTATTNATRGIYYNTIFLNAVSSGTNFGSSGIFHVYSLTATSSTLDMRNNNIVNNSTPNGTGFTVAFRRSASTNLNNYSETSNNNNFYAGSPGSSNLLFYDGTNEIQTMGDFKIFVNPRESASVTGFPPFVNITTPPYDLHIDPASPTQLESAGTPIISPIAINVDYDGDARYPNAGYPFNPSFPPTAPDIGADEFGGIPADLSPPDILYTQLNNTASTGNRTLTATITDPTGVQIGPNGPRLYYRKSTDPSYIFDDNPSIFDDEYTFTLNTALLGGVTLGTEIEYYVAAQDSAGNAGTNPSGGSGVNPPGTTPPGSPNSYTIVSGISGTFTVGATGDYLNLTAIANFLNSPTVEVTGNVIFELQNDYDGSTGETLPIVFNEFLNAGTGGAPFTVTIRPASGVTGKVTSGDPGSNFAFPVINFVGGKHFILDGRPGGLGSSNEWTIRNTRDVSTIGCVIRFADDGAYNTLRNLNLESQATLTTTGVIFFHTSTGSIGNSFNSVLFNSIRPRTDVGSPSISNGILSNGSLAAPNTANTISDNHITNFNNIAISLVTTNTGNGPDWVISDNQVYNPTHISTASQTGISIASAAATNMLVSGNFIGGSGPGATGTMTNSGTSVIITGIILSNGIATITNNTIGNITGTGTGTGARTRGITYTTPNDGVVISNNTIFNLVSNSAVVTGLVAGNQAAVGIHVFPGSTFYLSTITGNTIHNISAENTSAFATTHLSAGVFLTNFNGVFANNKIYDIKNKSTGITAGQPPVAAGVFIRFLSSSAALVNNMISLGSGENTNTQFNGIMVVAGTTNQNHYYYNSIAISGDIAGIFDFPWGSFAVLRGDNSAVSPGSPVYLYNNALFNNRQGGGSVNHVVGFQGTNGTLDVWADYNMLFNSNVNTIGLIDATSYNFAGWKTNSTKDTNSLSPASLIGSNMFTDIPTGNLNVLTNNPESWYLNGNAIPITGINVDFNGNGRSESISTGATDIGAVEFIPLVAPPNINIPVAGIGNYNINFAGKPLGEINFTNVGSSPAPVTEINVRYNSGIDPPNSAIDARYGNAYYDITPNAGASGYTYDVTIKYSDAQLGTIITENNIRLAKSDDNGANWTPYLVAGTGAEQYELNTTNKTIKVYGLTSLSYFALTDSDAPLPVELTSFSATVNRRDVHLNWTTASETNNSGFDIERKVSEGEEWVRLEFVEGSGTTNEVKNYSFADRGLNTGKYNYRLKQIDYNGNFEYFNLSNEVSIGIPDKYDLSQNYPNPFNPTTKINFDLPFDSKVTMKIFDITGREIATLVNEVQTAGYYTVTFDARNIASGAYFYRIIAEGGNEQYVMTKKMMVIK